MASKRIIRIQRLILNILCTNTTDLHFYNARGFDNRNTLHVVRQHRYMVRTQVHCTFTACYR